MLKALSALLDPLTRDGEGDDETSREHALQLATAVLMIEVARADFDRSDVEDDAIASLLESHLGLGRAEIAELIEEAEAQADRAASLQSFTRQLHESLSQAEKLSIIEMLWRVALADETLDKYEDHLIRKVAGLLYISHGDLIRIRNRVAPP